MLLCWRNSESSDSYYHLSVPTENSVGSNILCYVKDVNGDSGYRDVMFESSDDSIVEAPKKSIVQPNDAVLKVKKQELLRFLYTQNTTLL